MRYLAVFAGLLFFNWSHSFAQEWVEAYYIDLQGDTVQAEMELIEHYDGNINIRSNTDGEQVLSSLRVGDFKSIHSADRSFYSLKMGQDGIIAERLQSGELNLFLYQMERKEEEGKDKSGLSQYRTVYMIQREDVLMNIGERNLKQRAELLFAQNHLIIESVQDGSKGMDELEELVKHYNKWYRMMDWEGYEKHQRSMEETVRPDVQPK